MKTNLSLLLLTYFLSPFFCGAQEIAADMRMLPVAEFFKGEQFIDFKMDRDARFLYYRSPQRPATICRRPVKVYDRTDSIRADGSVTSWELLENNLLLVHGNKEVTYISEGGKRSKINVPAAARNVQILAKNKGDEHQAMLEIQGPDNVSSGLYLFDNEKLQLTKVYEHPGDKRLFFDGKLKQVAAHGPNELSGTNIYCFDENTADWKVIAKTSWSMDETIMGGFSKVLSVRADGKMIYYTCSDSTDKTALYRYDVDGQKREKLAGHDKVDLLPFGASIDRHGHVTSAVGLFAKTIREYTDGETQRDFLQIASMLDGDIGFIQSADNDSKWLIREFTGAPATIYLFDRTTKMLEKLLNTQPHLAAHPLAKRHAFSLKTPDGLELPFHLYLPAGSDSNNDGIPDRPLPLIIYVHGGPWAGVGHWNQPFHWRNFQLLASRGYAVINCEFRGSIGMGKKFVEASRKKWGQEMLEDHLLMADWAIEHGVADHEKTAIWGWSYGAYAAMAALAFRSDRFACGMAMYGPSDLESFGKTPFADRPFWHEWVGNPSDKADAQMLREFSPFHRAEAIRVPLLLTTGGKDERVPKKQLDDMAKVLNDANKEVVYFYYPDEVHDYRDDENWISFWAVAEKFLARSLGGGWDSATELPPPNYIFVYGEEFVQQE